MKEKELINKLEIYRFDKRLSQKDVADLLQVSFATVNRWFNKRNFPNKIQQYHIKRLIQLDEK